MVIMFIVSQFYIFFTTDHTMAELNRKLEILSYSSHLEIKPIFLKSLKMSTWIFFVVFLVSSVSLRTALE